jgi:UDP-N-acetyl-D-mannosaminuronate dehydrogenase
MIFPIIIGVWGVGMIGLITAKTLGVGINKTKVKVFNVSDRVVKHKKYKDALNERTKSIFK